MLDCELPVGAGHDAEPVPRDVVPGDVGYVGPGGDAESDLPVVLRAGEDVVVDGGGGVDRVYNDGLLAHGAGYELVLRYLYAACCPLGHYGHALPAEIEAVVPDGQARVHPVVVSDADAKGEISKLVMLEDEILYPESPYPPAALRYPVIGERTAPPSREVVHHLDRVPAYPVDRVVLQGWGCLAHRYPVGGALRYGTGA